MVDTLFFLGHGPKNQPPSAPWQAMRSWQIAGYQPALAKVACWCGTDGVDRGTKKPKTKRNGETWTDNSKKNHRTSEKKQKPGEIKKRSPSQLFPSGQAQHLQAVRKWSKCQSQRAQMTRQLRRHADFIYAQFVSTCGNFARDDDDKT